MKPPAALAAVSGLYGFVWRAARPLLRRHKRLADGFEERLVSKDWAPEAPVDLWIQAASGGEAFLARQLLAELAAPPASPIDSPASLSSLPAPLRVLCTSCTRQGLDILEAARQWAQNEAPRLHVTVRVFPFDEPALMRRAIALAAPKLLALLETELWPGLLLACAETKTPVALINGRITGKSLRGYRALSPLWRIAAPGRTLAIAEADAARFAALFGPGNVGVMPNMKFDGVDADGDAASDGNPFPNVLPDGLPVLLLASVRKEEEELLAPVIAALRKDAPDAAIVVAPRHMERVDSWRQLLDGSVLLRSAQQPAGPGSIVIWDSFGELRRLYARANAVFVGGSLAPLGGQNFLEAAVLGHVPVVGPHLKNFTWVGEEFFDQGLAKRVADAAALAPALLAELRGHATREEKAAKTAAYLAPHKGGARMAAALVREMLER